MWILLIFTIEAISDLFLNFSNILNICFDQFVLWYALDCVMFICEISY